MDHGKHQLLVRVYYEDTDAGGFVYHANYLKFAERARTEIPRQFGIEHRKTLKNHGVGFVVRACNMQFFKPALLDDLLIVDSEVLSVRGASFSLCQKISKGDKLLFCMDIKLACINANGAGTRIPKILRERFSDLKVLKGDGQNGG